MTTIKIKDLRFGYGHKEILKGINLDIEQGKLTGILGPNGCGKSTLLKNILGYVNKKSTAIEILGKTEAEYTQKEKARIMSFVPQKSNLLSPMSVIDFVTMGRLPHLKNMWEGYTHKDTELAKETIRVLGLESFTDRIALSLSGGEFQRVLLARALTQEPKILLLDEPTSALDLNHAVDLMSRVKKMVRHHDLTSITVLHDLNLASMFCDVIYIMKDGEIRYKGTPKEVLTEKILEEIYDLKSKVIYDDKGKPYVIPLEK